MHIYNHNYTSWVGEGISQSPICKVNYDHFALLYTTTTTTTCCRFPHVSAMYQKEMCLVQEFHLLHYTNPNPKDQEISQYTRNFPLVRK